MNHEELRNEKLAEMRMDYEYEKLLRNDYDYAFERIVLDSDCMLKIDECINKLVAEMKSLGWEITTKDVLEDFI